MGFILERKYTTLDKYGELLAMREPIKSKFFPEYRA